MSVRTRREADGVTESTTRPHIAEAALALFAARGYPSTSMREIAREVGLTVGSLYHHYSSKEEILWELVQQATRQLGEWQDHALVEVEGNGAGAALGAFVRTHVGYHALHSRQAEIVNQQIKSLSPQRYAEVIAWRDGYEQRLQLILEDGVRAGAFAVADVRITTFALLQMGTGIAAWYRPDGRLSVEQLCGLYETLALQQVRAGGGA